MRRWSPESEIVWAHKSDLGSGRGTDVDGSGDRRLDVEVDGTGRFFGPAARERSSSKEGIGSGRGRARNVSLGNRYDDRGRVVPPLEPPGVARDLAVGEKSRYGHVAENLADRRDLAREVFL